MIQQLFIPSLFFFFTCTLSFQDCNEFQAGDRLRSKVKSLKLDTKGVFGAICRHEMPLLFMNMFHGER